MNNAEEIRKLINLLESVDSKSNQLNEEHLAGELFWGAVAIAGVIGGWGGSILHRVITHKKRDIDEDDEPDQELELPTLEEFIRMVIDQAQENSDSPLTADTIAELTQEARIEYPIFVAGFKNHEDPKQVAWHAAQAANPELTPAEFEQIWAAATGQ